MHKPVHLKRNLTPEYAYVYMHLHTETHTFKATNQATHLGLIRHCVTDIWNLLTHLHPLHESLCGAAAAEGGQCSPGSVLHYALKASNISRLKEFVGEVFNMTGSICCRLCASRPSAFEAQRQIRHISAITACHEEQSHLEITQTAVFKDQT